MAAILVVAGLSNEVMMSATLQDRMISSREGEGAMPAWPQLTANAAIAMLMGVFVETATYDKGLEFSESLGGDISEKTWNLLTEPA